MHTTYAKFTGKNICIVCDKQFETYISQKTKKYCSSKCRKIKKETTIDEVYNKIIGEKVCITCNKTFNIHTSQEGKKYCSDRCRPKSKKNKITNCVVCNKPLVKHQKKLCGNHKCHEERTKVVSIREKVARDKINPVIINDMPIDLRQFKKFFDKLKGLVKKEEVIPEIEEVKEVPPPVVRKISPEERTERLQFYMENMERYKEGSIVCKYCDYIIPKKELHRKYIAGKYIQYYCPCSRRVEID